MNKAAINISPSLELKNPCVEFITSYLNELNAQRDIKEQIRKASMFILALLIEKNSDSVREPEKLLTVEIYESAGKIIIAFLNRGIPIYLNVSSGRRSDINFVSKFYEAMKNIDSLSVENLGREGQKITVATAIGSQSVKTMFKDEEFSVKKIHVKDEEIEIRELKKGEEYKLSRLFYSVYGYDYINEFVYYPEKIQTMIEQGKLISTVAVMKNGRILGHVGLVKWNDLPPVYEAALGLVDPLAKSRGLFAGIFQKTMETSSTIPMQYCFFDFVTNHDLSQKTISGYGTVDMALLIGCQTRTTQAKLKKLGIGADPEDMDRYTILFSIIPKTAHPFGKEIVLPESLGDTFEFLLRPLSVSWIPEPRFSMLEPQGDYALQYQPSQSAAIFDFFHPGRVSAEKILRDWSNLLKNGYRYAGVDVPVGKPGLGNLYDIFTDNGFFPAGFVPYKHSGKLAVRFQSIAPARVALDKIKLYSENAKKLLNIIKNYAQT